jgi:hypothetical protein
MQMEESTDRHESKIDTEKQKADALKKQIGKFSFDRNSNLERSYVDDTYVSLLNSDKEKKHLH